MISYRHFVLEGKLQPIPSKVRGHSKPSTSVRGKQQPVVSADDRGQIGKDRSYRFFINSKLDRFYQEEIKAGRGSVEH